MRRKLLCFIVTFVLTCQSLWSTNIPDISADGAVLIDLKTNTILYAKNMNLPFYPASTTKILTSLAIIQDMDLDKVITKTQDAVNNVPSDSSQIGLNVGDSYTVYDGLHAVLMSSDNFVCYDLAKADAGSIPAFADEMNHLALLSGATQFNFVNPHGYHDNNHYASPLSLGRIAISAFDNPILTEIAGTYSYNFTERNTGRVIPLTHTVALLDPNSPYYNPAVVAAKSGFHNEARRTLVAKAVTGDMELIGVVMRTDAPLQFEDMNKLFAYGFKNFTMLKDQDGVYSLENCTYTPWAKEYIDEALNNGWITNTSHNYQDPVTQREFINLLGSVSPSEMAEPVANMIQYNGDSIFIENRTATRTQIAKIIAKYLSYFDLTMLPSEEEIKDIDQLSSSEKEAITFCIQAHLISLKDGKFRPDDPLSYEEALCIISRLNGIITRYQSYHL